MTIGLNAAMPALAMLAAGPVVPAVIGVLGPLGAMAAGLSLSVLMLVLFPVLDLLPAWFLLRFGIGAGMRCTGPPAKPGSTGWPPSPAAAGWSRSTAACGAPGSPEGRRSWR